VLNARAIEEFRANGGKVRAFEGDPMLLIHHRGAKTGIPRVNPLMYMPDSRGFVVFATKAGGPHDPHWFLNLQANPQTQVEVGTETIDVTARELVGAERDEIWERQKAAMPRFAEYEQKAKGLREIPVVLLELQ
jgi:deazaflavin-dependent oxidoreductase (nitroreductase family)